MLNNQIMISELDKNILKRILHAKHPLSGAFLSDACHISINTLRKEITYINDYIKNHGCHIDTQISIGYSIVIDKPAIAHPFLQKMMRDISRFEYLNIEDYQKENYIIRRILSSQSTITIESLMDDLFCSKSTILRMIDRCHHYLDTYHLEIRNKRNVGLSIEGKEWYKRMCLINQHKIYKHEKINNLRNVPDFDAMMLNNTNYYYEIRASILNTLKEFPEISFAHVDIPLIVNFIILLKTRHTYSNELVFSDIQLKKAQHATYLARKITINLPEYIKESIQEKELTSLSVLLYGLNRYQITNLKDTPDFITANNSIRYLGSLLLGIFHLPEAYNDATLDELTLLLLEQKKINLCHILKDAENFDNTNKIGLVSSDITALISYYFDKYENIQLSLNALAEIYSIVNRSMYINNKYYHPLNFLLVSRYSTVIADSIAIRIQAHYSYYVNSIHTCESTELANMNLNNYDAILSDIEKPFLPVGIPIIDVSFNRDDLDFIHINEFINQTYKINALKIFKESDYITASYHSKEEIYSSIYHSLNINDIHEAEWITDIQAREKYLSFEREKEIILVTNLLYRYKEPVFKVFINQTPFLWDRQYAHIIIFYSYGEGTSKDIQTISYLNKQFIHQDESYVLKLNEIKYSDITQNFSLYNQL